MSEQAQSLWNELITKGKENQSNPEINIVDENGLNAILGTMDFFGADDRDLRQAFFDLHICKYRVFDWLAMGLQGRIDNKTALKVLIHAFRTAGYNEGKFIDNLYRIDYQVFTDWEQIEI